MAWTERYVRADAAGGGDGTTDTNSGANGAYTLAEANAVTTPNGIRFNVKSGSYSCTSSATRTFGQTIGANDSCCWRGFNSTIGDLDNEVDTTNFPVLDAGSGTGSHFNTAGGRYFFRNLRFLSASSSAGIAAFTCQSAQNRFLNCSFEMSAATRDGFGTSGTGDFAIVFGCRMEATDKGIDFGGNATCYAMDCYIYAPIGMDADSYIPMAHLIVDYDGGTATYGVDATVWTDVVFSTFYKSGPIQKSAQSLQQSIMGCLIANGVGYGIDGDSGATGNSSGVRSIRNTFYNNTSGQTVRIHENLQFNAVAAGGAPMVDAANGDYTPTTYAELQAEKTWLDLSTTSYADAGAVQSQLIFTATGGLTASNATLSGDATFTSGSTTYTGTGALTASNATLAGTAEFDAPVYTGTGALTSSNATLSADATFVTATFTGTAALTVNNTTIYALAETTVPNYYGTGALNSSNTTLSATAEFDTPGYSATGALTSQNTTLSASAEFDAPVYSGTSDLTSSNATLSASAIFATVVYSGTGDLISSNSTLSATAEFDVPIYSGTSDLTVSTVTLSATATSVGPQFAGTGALSVTAVTLSSAATYTFPTRTGTGALTVVNTELAATAEFDVPVYTGTSTLNVNNVTLDADATYFVPDRTGVGTLLMANTLLAATATYSVIGIGEKLLMVRRWNAKR